MKTLFFFFISILASNLLFAQTDNYKVAIAHFHTNYNDEKYDEIFNSFSPEMKRDLPLENTKQFLIGLKKQAGKIEIKEFVSYQQGTYATYKTKFEKAVLALSISLNKQNQINGFSVKPYEEPKNNQNNTISMLSNYPKEIAEIIFSRSKDLPNNTQLSIALIKNGKTNYYGMIKVNDTLKPAENQNKIFEIGSITKVFTSTVLASLVVDQKLKLTNPINTYYPFNFKNNTQITFKSLANHTSGLPRLPENFDLSNDINPYQNYGKKEIEAYLKNLLQFENPPLKISAYSNLGAGLLGYTLGLSQNTSFQKLLQTKIFDKYNMTNSFTSAQNLGSQLVKGLDENGKTVSNWDFDVLFGGGGILSTTEDLTKFANAQFNPNHTELALTRKPTFDVDQQMKIGLGWHILKSDNGKDLYWHNGGTGGYSSSMAINVEQKTAVIILSNVADINENVDDLCFELINKAN